MIVYPDYWRDIGRPIKLEKIEDTLIRIIQEMDCDCLAFSGGLDSSLLLHYMREIIGEVRVFTIGQADNHPDVEYARFVAQGQTGVDLKVFIPSKEESAYAQEAEEIQGDGAVRLFYKFVAKFTDSIATGDGIDEFMGGYYAHQKEPDEITYYDYLRRLQQGQLIPLDQNSGRVRVFLPFLDKRLLDLLTRVPLSEKVDKANRKKLMIELARGKVPKEVLERRKYGFCDALKGDL